MLPCSGSVGTVEVTWEVGFGLVPWFTGSGAGCWLSVVKRVQIVSHSSCVFLVIYMAILFQLVKVRFVSRILFLQNRFLIDQAEK